MADKRMIAKTITDRMRNVSAGAIKAYLFINLEADDDGVCQDIDLATYKTGCEQKDVDELVSKGFLIRFPANPNRVVVTHWWVNNTIPQSRRKKCGNEDFLELLELKGDTYFVKDEPIKPRLEAKVSDSKPKKNESKPTQDRIEEVFQKMVDYYKSFQDWQDPMMEDVKEARKKFVDYIERSGKDPGAVAGMALKMARDYFEAEESAGIQWSMSEMIDEVMGDTG